MSVGHRNPQGSANLGDSEVSLRVAQMVVEYTEAVDLRWSQKPQSAKAVEKSVLNYFNSQSIWQACPQIPDEHA